MRKKRFTAYFLLLITIFSSSANYADSFQVYSNHQSVFARVASKQIVVSKTNIGLKKMFPNLYTVNKDFNRDGQLDIAVLSSVGYGSNIFCYKAYLYNSVSKTFNKTRRNYCY